jgi:hypothetical protein
MGEMDGFCVAFGHREAKKQGEKEFFYMFERPPIQGCLAFQAWQQGQDVISMLQQNLSFKDED